MLSHGYPLQYLIYSLALHRHLQQRLPDYDPEQHFGGVYYLFLRGIQPEWSQTGVFYDRLDRTLLEAVDQLMAGVQ
jgi:exodeoxyribonuclease V beta subunit